MENNRVWLEDRETGMVKSTDEDLVRWIKSNCAKNFSGMELIVGTDSHLHGRVFRFVTVVCIYNPGYGGDFRHTLSYEDRTQYRGNQKARMFREVELSVKMADWLLDATEMVPVVHIDASPREANEFTSAFSDQLKGYVSSFGYEGVLKPGSYVANAVADKYTK